MKRFRNKNGELTMSIDQIKKETRGEALDYYRPGKIYLNAKDGREYVYITPDSLAHFQSFDGYNLFIPLDSLGTFLPGVASAGMELALVVDDPEELETLLEVECPKYENDCAACPYFCNCDQYSQIMRNK